MAGRHRSSAWVAGRRPARRLSFERLEDRQLLSLTHLYTFNDGLANDWIGSAHGTLFNGATITGGQLVLSNVGVTSGQTSTVKYMRLPANVLAGGDASIEVWYTATDSPDWARVFDIGNQSGGNGDSYLFFSPQSGAADSRAVLHPSAASERIASGLTTDDGSQHMAAIVIDTAADALRLYLDGTFAGSSPLAGASAGSVNDTLTYLGRSLFNADPGFTGSINELRIYDHALDDATIAANAAAGPSTATKSPLVRQMEYLNRGIVAIRNASTTVHIGWRLLGTDPAGIAFNLYRSANGAPAVKLNSTPLTQTTDFTDTTSTGLNLSVSNSYFVRPVIGGVEGAASESFLLAANTPTRLYLNVPLQVPAGGTVVVPAGTQTPPSGTLDYTYAANDASVGDVDGDGQYEIILKWDPTNAQDNANEGLTGPVLVDAYRLDGTLLWRINLGRNIRAGAHYTQFLVYDFDGDGRAEVVMKTADGTVDGTGAVIGNAAADYRDGYTGTGDSRWGRVLTGPEYLTVFNGLTGAAMQTISFSPERGSVTSWGDNYGNRVDRFLATVAYLDGVHPSIVMARGYYAKTRLTAYDWRNGQLTQRWAFDSTVGGNGAYGGQGNHNLSVADVDGDGKDEIIYGAMALDDTGVGLYTTGLGHGDALHVSDMLPSRPGLEVFQPHESPSSYGGAGGEYRDARTGQLIFGIPSTGDVGRGVAFDIDPNHEGYEMWATTADPEGGPRMIYNSQGQAIYATPGNMFYNFGVWWDADLLRELEDGTTISDWNYTTAGRSNYDLDPASSGTTAPNASSNNGTKSTPSLSGDILGDWREEVIWRRSDNTALEIFTTAIPATNRLVTLMHDSQYRQAIAWQNVAYNQPPHPGFFLGAGMALPATPQIYTTKFNPVLAGDYNGDSVVDMGDFVIWRKTIGTTDMRADGDGDGSIGQGDYAVWAANFGNSGPPQPILAFATGGPASTLPPPASGASSVEVELDVLNASTVDSSPRVTRPSFRPALRQSSPSAAATDLAVVLLAGSSSKRAVANTGMAGLQEHAEIDGNSGAANRLDAAFAFVGIPKSLVREAN